jgi:glycosyltransferase involved in cell wall biosynthesis
LVVVNDGSKDRTGEIIDLHANDGGLVALHHKVNRGYGGAIKTGILAAKTEFLVTVDADGQHDLKDIDELYHAILSHDADMVVGSRGNQASQTMYRAIGKKIIRTFAKLLMPVPIHDINSGMKVYRAAIAKTSAYLCPDSMAFSDIITLVFLNQRRLVLERPIGISKRTAGQSTVNTRAAFDTIMEIINILILFNPMRVFIPVSVAAVLAGLAWGLPIVIRGRGVSVAAMMLIVTGVLSFLLGLIAEQLSMLRKAGSSASFREHRRGVAQGGGELTENGRHL